MATTTSQARHGSTARARSGCPCGPCDRKRTSLYMMTPRGSKAPKTTRRLGSAVVLLPGEGDERLEVEPTAAEQAAGMLPTLYTKGLGNGEMAALAEATGVRAWMSKPTYAHLLECDQCLTEALLMVSEARKQMPKAVKRELTHMRRPGRTVKPGEDPKAPLDLSVLGSQVTTLLASLASGQMEFGVAMKQYGHLRDEIARRRSEFVAIEGVFEALQVLIVERAVE